MTAKVFERILTFLFITIVVALGIALMLLSFGVISPETVNGFITSVRSSAAVSLAVAFTGLVLLLLSGALIFLIIRSGRKVKTCPIYQGENGSCFISDEAVSSLIKHFCCGYPSVRECFTNLLLREHVVSAGVRLLVDADTKVAALTDGAINEALKRYLSESVGISVGEVDILIENVTDTATNH